MRTALLALFALVLLVPARAQDASTIMLEACTYDPEKAAVADYLSLVDETDAAVGPADAAVTVIEFFDPNCPHCKTVHPAMKEVVAAYGDRVRFVYKPVVILGNRSTAQVAALHMAAEAGVFEEMMERQFALQSRTGLSIEHLQSLSAELGMPTGGFLPALEGYLPKMRAELERFRSTGLTGVPAVLVNGRAVAGSARTADCIGRLIEKAGG